VIRQDVAEANRTASTMVFEEADYMLGKGMDPHAIRTK
jgi:hypothetical protein